MSLAAVLDILEGSRGTLISVDAILSSADYAMARIQWIEVSNLKHTRKKLEVKLDELGEEEEYDEGYDV